MKLLTTDDFNPYTILELPHEALNNFAIENNCSYDTAEYACNGLPACDLDRERLDLGLIPHEELGEGLRHA